MLKIAGFKENVELLEVFSVMGAVSLIYVYVFFLQGYTGDRCDKVATVCDSVKCDNGGVCQPIGSSFKCHCPAGFSGTRCELEIKECASNPCQNGGACLDSEGWRSCFCHLSLCVRKPKIWVQTRSDTNRPVQAQKMARGGKFWI